MTPQAVDRQWGKVPRRVPHSAALFHGAFGEYDRTSAVVPLGQHGLVHCPFLPPHFHDTMTHPLLSRRSVAALAAAASIALLGACASKGVNPVAELATAQASISQAESAGALQLAPVEMLAARDKMNKAAAAARDERFTESRRLAEEAAADADVAERKSRAMKSTRAAEELNRANAALQQEATRKP